MTGSDEQIQNDLDAGLSSGNSAEHVAYRKIFRALSNDPYPNQPGLADRVVSRVTSSAAGDRDLFWLAAGIALFLAAAALAIVKTGFNPHVNIFKPFSGYSGFVIFAVAFILLINLIDRIWLRDKLKIYP